MLCNEISDFDQFDFDQFRELMAIVNSRTFDLQFGDDEEEKTVLVPYAGMINHSTHGQVILYYNPENNGVVLRALKPIKEMTELCMNYGFG